MNILGGKRMAVAGDVIAVDQANGGRICVFNSMSDWSATGVVRWSWAPTESHGIPAEHRGWFSSPSEARWCEDYVLLAASGGGVAVIRYADQKVVFHANAGGNPHAVELLPGGVLVSASSTGSRVTLFFCHDTTVVPMTYPVMDAHGLVWDQRTGHLWVSGNRSDPTKAGGTVQLIKFSYDQSARSLTKLGEVDFPTWPNELVHDKGYWESGHDLFAVPESNRVLLTTDRRVWDYDLRTGEKHPGAYDIPTVKSVSVNPETGQWMLVRPTRGWVSDTVWFGFPDSIRTFPGAEFYKARWFGEVCGWPHADYDATDTYTRTLPQ